MALYEIAFELPSTTDDRVLVAAVDALGYGDAQVRCNDLDGMFSILISHPSSKFETGIMLAEMILPHLPTGSRYLSHRSAVSIREMSADDLDAFLIELENSTYGQSAV